jgi:predicted carbohydrate-binding protein with CBM5 and CBM33 domain
MKLTATSLLAALATTVSGHGYVELVTAGGVSYTGYLVSLVFTTDSKENVDAQSLTKIHT